ncbi:MAG TPA: matrixin family metalloprotease [Nitrosopumilaceae archaeon]|nr:matrixin family metalloprotease [Nitrosopumilaceae archaeon]
MRAMFAVLFAVLLVMAVIPHDDTFAAKSSKFKVSVDELKGPKTITLPNGQVLERSVHIFYKKDFAKPPNVGGGGKGADTCYAVLAKGANWKVTEPYIVDSTNQAGLADDFVRTATSTSLETWDVQVPAEIFGSEIAGVVDGLDTQTTDGKNEVMFGSIDDPGAIAVTITWGIFGGPPSGRQLVEWDAMFDDADFAWGNADPAAMDFQNIATHEFGHAAGMGHPSNSCTEETMYAFADVGETKKRDLNTGDINGIKALYK